MRKIILNVHVLAIITITLWASAFVGIRIGLKSYSPGAMALLRYVFASIVMIPLYFNFRNLNRDEALNFREKMLVFLLGFFGIGIYNVVLNYAEITIPAGTASFIINQSPVLMVILAIFLLKEQLSIMGWIGLFISFSGVALIAVGESQSLQFNMGIFYVLLATIISALYSVLQKPLLKKMHSIEINALIMFSGTFAMLPFALQLGHELPKATLASSLIVLYLGIFPGIIAYSLWSMIIAKMPASKAASYPYLIPLVSTFLGWLLIGEIPHLLSFIGGCIAVCGAILAQRTKSASNGKGVVPQKES